MQQPRTITLAPLRGITDALFREVFFRHFDGFDQALAPFISPQKYSDFPDKMLKDILPDNNCGISVIPQILHTDPYPFITLARRLASLGYSALNWNLGCPAPQVTKKKRGSGLLPYPQEICQILEEVLPKLDKMGCTLSIKMRLGYHDKGEILTLLPLLDNYPLKEIIIHPRVGKQLYRGDTDVEGFGQCLALTRHQLVYNGDIIDHQSFSTLQHRYPAIASWMIGRGALARPFLAENIRGILRQEEPKSRLYNYHRELFERYSIHLSGPSHLLGRMKLIWGYLITAFPGKEKQLKKITKSSTIEKYLIAVEQLFA